MRIVFVTNYYTHHQSPFSEEMVKKEGIEYYFIETERMAQERINMGWEIHIPSFVKSILDNRAECEELIMSADVAIIGDAPYDLVKKRINTKKITFIYSERIYKKFIEWYKYPVRFFRLNKRYNHRNVYLLCASAYAAYDFSRTFTFLKKAFKWGYFPKKYSYDIKKILQQKQEGKISLLWTARMIYWKRPEFAVEIAKDLRERGYDFSLTMIGDGPKRPKIEKKIAEYKLDDYVSLTGNIKPEQVREYMEKANIFLFTSNRQEGWGAVLNEAMNSGCACIASKKIGASLYLIDNGKNGLMYDSYDELLQNVLNVINDKELMNKLGYNAYETIANVWNAENATEQLLSLIEKIKNNDNLYAVEGPCSRAQIKRSLYD